MTHMGLFLTKVKPARLDHLKVLAPENSTRTPYDAVDVQEGWQEKGSTDWAASWQTLHTPKVH